ncbi:MAG: hypothetical protein P1U36_04990 [Legionellaceae bacterium]|nr:hypothetical protein [Legionellaceae bacterium]
MPSINTKQSMLIEGYTDASIKYGIKNHRYDRAKYSFIETDLIFSAFHLVSTLLQLALVCLGSVFMGFSLTIALLQYSYFFLLAISCLFAYVGIDFFLMALERGLELFLSWLVSVPGLYFLAGLFVIFSAIMFFRILDNTLDLVYDVYAIPACFYHLAIFPFATAINFFFLISNTFYYCVFYLMDCFDLRPAHEILTEYLNEHLEIKHICLDLESENTLDLEQLRYVIALIPDAVETIELCTPFEPFYSEATQVILFETLNSMHRKKIVFNTEKLTDKWESWQNTQTFYALEQTEAINRPRLNQDVIRFGIFSYLEPSDMPAMFDGLCPPPPSYAYV